MPTNKLLSAEIACFFSVARVPFLTAVSDWVLPEALHKPRFAFQAKGRRFLPFRMLKALVENFAQG